MPFPRRLEKALRETANEDWVAAAEADSSCLAALGRRNDNLDRKRQW